MTLKNTSIVVVGGSSGIGLAPSRLLELVQDPDDAIASRAMQAMFGMKKIIIADIERAVMI